MNTGRVIGDLNTGYVGSTHVHVFTSFYNVSQHLTTLNIHPIQGTGKRRRCLGGVCNAQSVEEGGKGESVYDDIERSRRRSHEEGVRCRRRAVRVLDDDERCKRTSVHSVQNYQNITTYPNSTVRLPREDMMGGFFYRYSDNGGETWSDEAFQIEIPQTKIDRQNQWNGTVQLMWLVDKGFQIGNDAFVAFTKIGLYAVEPP